MALGRRGNEGGERKVFDLWRETGGNGDTSQLITRLRCVEIVTTTGGETLGIVMAHGRSIAVDRMLVITLRDDTEAWGCGAFLPTNDAKADGYGALPPSRAMKTERHGALPPSRATKVEGHGALPPSREMKTERHGALLPSRATKAEGHGALPPLRATKVEGHGALSIHIRHSPSFS